MNFNRNGSMNNIHNVEKTMQKYQQLAKDAQSNGDPVLCKIICNMPTLQKIY